MSYTLETIDHDADAGLTICADSIAELFRATALGMLDIVIDRNRIESRTTRIVSATAESADLLLVDFLSELLSLVQVNNFAPFDIEIGEITETSIIAEVSGQRVIPDAALKTEIKLVTYHQLDVHRDEDGKWHARIIFDL